MSADHDLETFTEWLKGTAAERDAPEPADEPAVRVDLDLGGADVTGVSSFDPAAARTKAFADWVLG